MSTRPGGTKNNMNETRDASKVNITTTNTMDASPDAVHSAPTHLEGITRVCFSPDGK